MFLVFHFFISYANSQFSVRLVLSENSKTFFEVTVNTWHFWWVRLPYNLLWNRIGLSYHINNISFHTALYKKFFWEFCSNEYTNPQPNATMEKTIALLKTQESHSQGQILHFQEHTSQLIRFQKGAMFLFFSSFHFLCKFLVFREISTV